MFPLRDGEFFTGYTSLFRRGALRIGCYWESQFSRTGTHQVVTFIIRKMTTAFFSEKYQKREHGLHFYRSWARTICPRSDKAHCNQKEGILAGGPPCCCEKLNLLFDINITVLGNQLHGGFWTGSNSAPDFHGVSFT